MHCTGVHVKVFQRHLRIVAGHARHSLPPELRCLKHVRFINRGNFAAPLECGVKSDSCDAFDFMNRITQCVNGNTVTVNPSEAAWLAKIETAEEFANDKN